MKPNILVLDDDLMVRSLLKRGLSENYNVNEFDTGEKAISFIERNQVDLALLDIDLGTGINGITTLERLVEIEPKLSVIMISSITDINTVVKSIKLGAIDFIEKPIDISKLKFRIKKNLEFKQMKSVVARYKNSKEKDFSQNTITGTSEIILNCKQQIENAGPMRLLLLGETGVGKTPFAKYSNLILSSENTPDRPFEQINCACLKRERFVDELFGHVKGAYTGAISDKRGLVELAEGGDLFLDEIGDLDLECQAELLTYLDHYEYYKLGGTKKMKSVVRIISATNKDLKKMIAQGLFRKDLYSRIAQFSIRIPPLRERKEDIDALVKHFIYFFTNTNKNINSDVISHLQKFDWEEGNVRDLRNICEYMCITSKHDQSIELKHIPELYFAPQNNFYPYNTFIEQIEISQIEEMGYLEYLNMIEYQILKKLLSSAENVKSLADKINIDRMTLSRKLIKLNLKH